MSVLVFTENWDGKFKKSSFELVSYASQVAGMMNTTTVVLSLGKVHKSELEKLGGFGAHKIINGVGENLDIFDSLAHSRVISDIAVKEGATVVILSNSNSGKALAPRISVRLKAGIGAGVSKLPISISPFVVYKRAFSGNAFAHLTIRTDIKIITLAQNSFELIEKNAGASIEDVSIQIDGVKTQVIGGEETIRQNIADRCRYSSIWRQGNEITR